MFRLDPGGSTAEPLREVGTSRIPDIGEGVLFLSFSWHPSSPDILAITTSTGAVWLVRLDITTFKITSSQEVPIANTLECWCVSFSPVVSDAEGQGSAVVYAGGDDSGLRYALSSLTLDDDDESALAHLPYPAAMMKKDHDAGVTAILPLSLHLDDGSRVVLTGSYDENIRVFSVQDPQNTFGIKRTRLLAECGLGGGVWRLKLIELRESCGSEKSWTIRLLVSCMHAGTRIVDVSISQTGSASVRVVYRFEEHKSMNYGSDWAPSVGGGGVDVVSTSFYDNLLCLWKACS